MTGSGHMNRMSIRMSPTTALYSSTLHNHAYIRAKVGLGCKDLKSSVTILLCNSNLHSEINNAVKMCYINCIMTLESTFTWLNPKSLN